MWCGRAAWNGLLPPSMPPYSASSSWLSTPGSRFAAILAAICCNTAALTAASFPGGFAPTHGLHGIGIVHAMAPLHLERAPPHRSC